MEAKLVKPVEIDVWAELHSDFLNEIVKGVYCYDDYVRLRAVCRQWNLELPKIPNHPWLVVPCNDDKLGLKEKELYHLRLPEMQDSRLRGSCYGYLIRIDIDGRLQIFNPFTKVHFDLPHASTFPDIVAYEPDKHDEEYTIRDMDMTDGSTYTKEKIHVLLAQVEKIILSCPPSHDNQDCIAVAIYGVHSRLAFCRLGDNSWIDIPTTEIESGYEDAIFHEGKIYVINWKAQLYEFDMNTKSFPLQRISEAPPPRDIYIPYANWNTKYLIECPDGDVLMVIRHLDYFPNPKGGVSCYKTKRFDIHKLNKEAKQWSRVFSLGNYVIVIGFNSSAWMFPHTFPDNKGNRIYYTDNLLEPQYSLHVGGHDIGFLNLEDGSIHQLFPNLDLLCPPPIWLCP